MGKEFYNNPFKILSRNDYIDVVIKQLEHLRKENTEVIMLISIDRKTSTNRIFTLSTKSMGTLSSFSRKTTAAVMGINRIAESTIFA